MGYGFSIDPVPPEGRKYGLTENFAIWFGAGISIAEFWAGASLVAVPISLSLKSSLVAILLGHAIGNALLAAVGYVGVKTGLPTMVISRMSLGLKGSYLVSALNYLQLIGWTAVMLVVGALAMNNLSLSYGLGNLYFLWVAVLGASVTAWSLIGPEKWGSVEKGAAALLLALTIWLGYVLFTQYGVAPPEFGASKHIASAILAAMKINPEMRAAGNIAYNESIRAAVEKLGLSWSYFDRDEEPLEVKNVEGGTTPLGVSKAAERLGGKLPEAIFDYGEYGKEPLTLIFGRTAKEVAEKIISIAKEVSKE